MKDWIQNNIKTYSIIYGIICSIVGFIVGIYVMERTISNDLQALQKLHQQDYDYTMKILRASGAFYKDITGE